MWKRLIEGQIKFFPHNFFFGGGLTHNRLKYGPDYLIVTRAVSAIAERFIV